MTSHRGSTKVLVGDGKLLPIANVRNLSIKTHSRPLTLVSVRHVPELRHNILSVRRLC